MMARKCIDSKCVVSVKYFTSTSVSVFFVIEPFRGSSEFAFLRDRQQYLFIIIYYSVTGHLVAQHSPSLHACESAAACLHAKELHPFDSALALINNPSLHFFPVPLLPLFLFNFSFLPNQLILCNLRNLPK